MRPGKRSHALSLRGDVREKDSRAAMSFIITPRQLQRRADLYYQMGQLTSAGLGMLQTLEQLRRKPPAGSYRLPLGRIIEEINHGFTLSEALRRQGQWLPEFDLAVIQGGEKGGRLEDSF